MNLTRSSSNTPTVRAVIVIIAFILLSSSLFSFLAAAGLNLAVNSSGSSLPSYNITANGEQQQSIQNRILDSLFSNVTTSSSCSPAAIWTNASSYPPESVVGIYGCGFLTSALINVSVTEPNATVNTWQVTSDSSGNFTTSYQLDDLNGTYYATATDAVNTATVNFTDPSPSISLSPTSGTTGTVVTVTGSSFQMDKGDTIQIKFDSTTETTSPNPCVVQTGNGFSCTFIVPSSTVGSHTVTATDLTSGNHASATFNYLSDTTTTVNCASSSIAVGATTTCNVNLMGTSGSTSGETITFSKSAGTGSITFPAGSTCILNTGGHVCATAVTIQGSGIGPVTIKGSYPGDSNNNASYGTFDLTVTSATYSVSFDQSNIPTSGVTWGVTIGSTDYTGTGSSIVVSGLSGTPSFSYDSPVAGSTDTQYICSSGCSGSLSSSTTSESATYTTQYKITFDAPAIRAGGDVSGSTSVLVIVIGGSGYGGPGCTGGTGGSTTTVTETMLGSSGYTTAFITSGANVCYSYISPIASTSTTKQYAWATTSGLGQTGRYNSFQLSSAGTVSATYNIQYLQTFDSSSNVKSDGSGTIVSVTIGANPAVHCAASDLPSSTNCQFWVDDGTSVSFTYTPTVASFSDPTGTQYVLTGVFTSPYTVSSSNTLTGNYQTQYYLTVNSACSPGGADWYDSGSSASATSAGTCSRSGGTGTRISSYYIDYGPNVAQSTTGTITVGVTMDGPHTVNFNSVTQYLLTVSVSPLSAGSVTISTLPTITGDTGWYDSGTIVSLSESTNPGFTFSIWTVSSGSTSSLLSSDSIKVTMSSAVNAVANYLQITVNTCIADGNYNCSDTIQAVFTSCTSGTSATCQLTATNPGQEFYVIQFTNNQATSITGLVVNIAIPSDNLGTVNYCAFVTQGAQPVMVNGMPASFTQLSCTISVNVGNVGPGQTVVLTVHLDYGLKYKYTSAACSSLGPYYCTTTAFNRGYSLQTTITFNGQSAQVYGSVAVIGTKTTAIGGFLTDTNGNPKQSLQVFVYSGKTGCPATAMGTPVRSVPSDMSGWYFVNLSSGGTYTVCIYDSMNQLQNGNSGSVVTLSTNQFVELDDNKLPVADPVITGQVTTSSGVPLAGVTVQLIGVSGKVLATTTTDGLGYYVFRFSQPGTYTVKIIAPAGYSCPNSCSTTVTISQFQTIKVNFLLAKTE